MQVAGFGFRVLPHIREMPAHSCLRRPAGWQPADPKKLEQRKALSHKLLQVIRKRRDHAADDI